MEAGPKPSLLSGSGVEALRTPSLVTVIYESLHVSRATGKQGRWGDGAGLEPYFQTHLLVGGRMGLLYVGIVSLIRVGSGTGRQPRGWTGYTWSCCTPKSAQGDSWDISEGVS